MDFEKIEDSEQYKQLVATLESFEKDVAGLPRLCNLVAPEVLGANVSDLVKKDPSQLSEYIFLLNQYSLSLQRLLNKHKAFERWSLSKLDELEAHFLPEVPMHYGWSEKSKIARNTPEICRKVQEFLRKNQMQASLLYDIPNQVKIMSDSIKDIKFNAIRREKEYNAQS